MDGALNRSGERKQNSAASMSGFTGELSNNNDDGSENITKKKISSFQTPSRLFGTAQFVTCTRLFLELNREKSVIVSVHVLHETSHWEVARRSRVVDVKDNSNVLTNVMHVQSSCFAGKTNFFLTLSLSSLSSLLKLPKSPGRIITRGQSISGHVVQAKM